MKSTRLLALVALLASCLSASAYDFMADGIAYDINDDKTTASVTHTDLNGENYPGLRVALIPDAVTCDGITYTVTEIEPLAFAGCQKLEMVSISKSVRNIGENAFGKCAPAHVFVFSTWPPQVSIYSFSDDCFRKALLHVPQGCYDIYTDNKSWSMFRNVTEMNPSIDADINHDGEVDIKDLNIIINRILGQE